MSLENHHRPELKTLNSVAYFGVHAACLIGMFTIAPTQTAIVMSVALYLSSMFGITAGYHRYFSHRSYKTTRPFQFFLAVLGSVAAQKGVLWWAAEHRHHHLHSDKFEDHHSPVQHGFLWSHVGWFLSKLPPKDARTVHDLIRFPELRLVNRLSLFVPATAAGLTYQIDGMAGLVWGFGVSTLCCWHATYCINSLSHLIGSRRYETPDNSRNSLLLALLTMGEGWHNNHHRYPSSARQGFFAWEIDATYYALLLLTFFGIVWDLRDPPPSAYYSHNHFSTSTPRPSLVQTHVSNSAYIDTQKSRCYIDKFGILRVEFCAGARISIQDARETTVACQKLVGKAPRPALVDFRPARSIDKRAHRYFFRNDRHIATYVAVAVITATRFGASIGSLAAQLQHPRRPWKLFTSEVDATDWLADFRSIPADPESHDKEDL